MKNIKPFKIFEGNEENQNVDIKLSNMNQSDLEGYPTLTVGKYTFYKDLGDRKFTMYSNSVNDTDLHTVYLKYDVVLFNLIYPANDKDYCYYTRNLYLSDIAISTQPLSKTNIIIDEFSSKTLEEQVKYLTFVGGVFKKQKRMK